MVYNHFAKECIQASGPMLLAFLAILLLAVGQVYVGLLIPALVTFINCALYLVIIIANELKNLEILHKLQTSNKNKS